MKEHVSAAFREIKEDSCIIICGSVIAVIMEHLFLEENKNRCQWQPQNGRGYIIRGSTYEELP